MRRKAKKRKREPIDDLIEALVSMRRQAKKAKKKSRQTKKEAKTAHQKSATQ
jgi:hypothetical protein